MTSGLLPFHKYQGLANDFIVVDLRDHTPTPSPEQLKNGVFELARRLCDRRLGIGGDGVLSLSAATSDDAVATMRVLNADGSEAEMCGNGLRCVAKHLLETREGQPDAVVIDTGAGPLRCQAHWQDGVVVATTIDMGRPRLRYAEVPARGPADENAVEKDYVVAGRRIAFRPVGMGNPHAIGFVEESGEALMTLARSVGPVLEHHEDFPARTNVEFTHVHSATSLELVVWERGVGITQACGTGACATVVAACLSGHCEAGTKVAVTLPGGVLEIEVAKDYSRVFMTGPAELVFAGEVDLTRFA